MSDQPLGTRESEGSRKLREFMAKHEVSQARAAEALSVSGPTVNDWANGKKTPKAHYQRALRVWTRGEILESDWDLARDREAVDQVRPFEPPSSAVDVADADADVAADAERATPTGTG